MSSHEPINDDDRQLWSRFDGARPPERSVCPSSIELAAFAEGRLDDDAGGAAESHLADCGVCRQALLDVAAAGAGQEALPFAGLPVIDAAKALVARSRDRTGRRTLGAIRAVGAAAAAIVICFVGYRAGSAWYDPAAILAEEALVSEMSFGLLAVGEPDVDLLMRSFEETAPWSNS